MAEFDISRTDAVRIEEQGLVISKLCKEIWGENLHGTLTSIAAQCKVLADLCDELLAPKVTVTSSEIGPKVHLSSLLRRKPEVFIDDLLDKPSSEITSNVDDLQVSDWKREGLSLEQRITAMLLPGELTQAQISEQLEEAFPNMISEGSIYGTLARMKAQKQVERLGRSYRLLHS